MSRTAGRPGWHADPESLRRWVDGTSGPVVGASVEQHLLTCPACRAAVAPLVAAPPLAQVWDGVLARVEAPEPGPLQRLLVRLRVSPGDALLVAAAPSARLAWLSGIAAVLMFAVLASTYAADEGLALFLTVAPLVPVGAVATAYGRTADPSYELAVAAPYSTLRLALLRTAAVLASSVPLAMLAGLLLPVPVPLAWLLPSAGLVALVLVASTRFDPVLAAGAVAAGWVAVVAVSTRTGDPLALLAPAAATAYLAAVVVAGLVLVARARPAAATPGWTPP